MGGIARLSDSAKYLMKLFAVDFKRAKKQLEKKIEEARQIIYNEQRNESEFICKRQELANTIFDLMNAQDDIPPIQFKLESNIQPIEKELGVKKRELRLNTRLVHQTTKQLNELKNKLRVL